MATKIFFCFCCCFFLTIHEAAAMQLREQFSQAEAGDYIVAAQSKNMTLFHILSKTGSRLTIEEITVPSKQIKSQHLSWQTWLDQGAPEHTAWVIYELDLSTSQVLRCYSFTQRQWLSMSSDENFLSILLTLHLQKIPLEDRKRVGMNPLGQRALWQPPLVFEGTKISGIPFDGWRTHWPQDGSELAGKKISLYLPSERDDYLSYFPYWIEVTGIIGKAKLRIVDSGRLLHSPKTGFPHS